MRRGCLKRKLPGVRNPSALVDFWQGQCRGWVMSWVFWNSSNWDYDTPGIDERRVYAFFAKFFFLCHTSVSADSHSSVICMDQKHLVHKAYLRMPRSWVHFKSLPKAVIWIVSHELSVKSRHISTNKELETRQSYHLIDHYHSIHNGPRVNTAIKLVFSESCALVHNSTLISIRFEIIILNDIIVIRKLDVTNRESVL